jgi:thioredoxin-dependent peroxiredoxin
VAKGEGSISGSAGYESNTIVGVIRSTVPVVPTGNIAHVSYNVKATGHVAKLLRNLKLDAPTGF